MEMTDADSSKEAHKTRPYLAEIKRLRQNSQDLAQDRDRDRDRDRDNHDVDEDFDGGAAKRGRAGKRAAITDVAAYKRSRSHTHTGQSFDDRSEAVDGALDDSNKFKTLPWNMKPREHARKNMDQPKILHQGWLYKTSRRITLHMARGQHDHRQYRRFQLTEHSLEYSQLLQRVKIRKQFPFTSIYDIVYNEENPDTFKLKFRKSEVLLEARNKHECEQWVMAITKEWERWPKPVHKASIVNRSSVGVVEKSGQEQGEMGHHIRTSYSGKDTPQAELPSSPCNEAQFYRFLRQESDSSERSFRRPHASASLTKIAIGAKLGLIPRIHDSTKVDKLMQRLDTCKGDDLGKGKNLALLHKLDYVMTKYPRKRKSNSLPHERVFTMDYENLLIMWRQTEYSKFNQLSTLLTEHIVEVREVQNSDGFDRYPYEEKKEQSLSLLVEGEIQAGPAGSNKYAVLQSLDLVCDSAEEKRLWCHALKSLIHPKKHLSMFSNRFEFTDPTILWINFHWTLLSEGEPEIREDEALSFGQSVVPQMPARSLKNKLDVAHRYMLSESSHHGSSLHWDSFVLFYNLLCGIDDSNCLLLKIYQDYAKDSPTLGMTTKEFKNFLIDQQNWSPDDTTDERCDQLIGLYDHYHEPFKKYLAKSNPEQFSTSLDLFSFAGFLSFLRSVHNCVTDRNHETVYQDMTQPLSHYFINSSHNTYLEGHQLIGLSTTDAYVRALLQGCRCLELDCWDGPNGEPKITHGNTLVSELSLEEVAQTINEYAFRVSDYPLILSLENHCNEIQQARMAKIFLDVFKDKLVQKNLVEEERLDRLPSPDNLKKKIILKGRRKPPDERRASDERGRGILQRVQRTIRQFYRPSPSDNDRTNLQASQNLEVLNKENSLESNHSDEQDNLTIVITTAGEIGVASGKSDKTTDSEEEPKPEYEEEQKKLHEDLSKLVVYCQAKRIKPWSWKEQQKTSVCNMFSFVESAALNKCREYPKELLACTERQFVRTYPSGLKTDSSNYDPHPMWNTGIQMVALNIQTPGLPMYLNQGKFRQNGGCGYVLKPKVMRDPGETVYTPSMTKPHPAVTPVSLKITPLSGQNFIIPNKTTTTMEILYQTYGIPEDCESLKHIVTSENTNPLWPQFSGVLMLDKTILMPELCLVLFAVNINVRRKLKAGTKQVLLGQNVIPLTSLKPGIRFVPLRKPGGDPVSHIGIFVKIELSQKQASDGLEIPISPHSDTQQTNGSLEDENCGSQMNDATNLESTNIANEVHHKSQKLTRQQAVTVDVHLDNVHNASSDC